MLLCKMTAAFPCFPHSTEQLVLEAKQGQDVRTSLLGHFHEYDRLLILPQHTIIIHRQPFYRTNHARDFTVNVKG